MKHRPLRWSLMTPYYKSECNKFFNFNHRVSDYTWPYPLWRVSTLDALLKTLNNNFLIYHLLPRVNNEKFLTEIETLFSYYSFQIDMKLNSRWYLQTEYHDISSVKNSLSKGKQFLSNIFVPRIQSKFGNKTEKKKIFVSGFSIL